MMVHHWMNLSQSLAYVTVVVFVLTILWSFLQQHWTIGIDAVSKGEKAMTYGIGLSFNETDNVMKHAKTRVEALFGWSGDDTAIREWYSVLAPEFENFLDDDYISPDGAYRIPKQGSHVHLSADRPMLNSLMGAFACTQENCLGYQDAVKRHIMTAPYQSRPVFDGRAIWERRIEGIKAEKNMKKCVRNWVRKASRFMRKREFSNRMGMATSGGIGKN